MDERADVRRSGWLGLGTFLTVFALLATGCGDTLEHHEPTHDSKAHVVSEARIARAEGSPTTLMGADLVHCIATAEQTDGGYSFLAIQIPAGSGPQPHQHDSADEWFYILSGTASIQVGEVQAEVEPGDYFHIPRGTTHTIKAVEDVRLVAGYSPGGEEGRLFCPS